MSANSDKRKSRPSYPSAARQWQGFFTIVIAVGFLRAFHLNVAPLASPGIILLLVSVGVTYWSGLRMGLIVSALSLLYMSYVYSIPGTYLQYSPKDANRMATGLILFPTFVLLVGGVQNSLRKSATSEWDAREQAEQEATQRRFAEEALRSREDLWRLVVNSAMDGIITTDEAGVITLWNPNAEAMFGWKSEEIIGRKLSETIIPSALRVDHEKGIQRFLATGEAFVLGKRLELTGLAKDGHEFPIELSIVPHKTDAGHIFMGFVRDTTEQKKLNERLRQAQKMEAIGTLAGGIAHDFNNILTAISGNLMLIRSEATTSPSTSESIAEIDKAVSRATYLVRQILTFSHVRETHHEPIDLASTLSEAIKLLQATIPTTTQIEAYFEPGLPHIVADSTDIHQLVLNLGINAHQAMRGSSGKFEIQATAITLDADTAQSLLSIKPGKYVRISAGDTGCGMEPQTLQRAFEPFFTTKALGEGTGLGLSVVYGIVERHQGAITVYSEPNKGTVFHIYFPATEALSEKAEPKNPKTVQGDGERILYVDDDEALVFMMTRMLRSLNYSVVGHQNPREALEAFQSHPESFDLLITDMSMPHLDGPGLVRAVQSIRPDLPIVMVTGYIRPTDVEAAQNLGVQELILKPNTVHEMGETLHRILGDLKPTSPS